MPKPEEGENAHVLEARLGRHDLFDMAGRVALVTGGGSGIGAAVAAGLAANGAEVFVCSRKDTSSFAEQLTKKGPGSCVSIPADLTLQADVDHIVEVLQRGPGKLHCLVNNAGANWAQPLEEFEISGWNKTNDLNVTAVFNMTKCALPLLRAAATEGDPARVINIASTSGIATPLLDTFAYSAGKAAVIHLTEVLAGRLVSDRIAVNCICPGPFQSRMMRGTIRAAGGGGALGQGLLNGRIGAPGDVAGLALYLASPAGSWTTGATIVLDGGGLQLPRF